MAATPVQVEQVEGKQREEDLALFDLVLRKVPLPVTLKPERRLTSNELGAFCEANDNFEIEYAADGTLTIMSPAKRQTSRLNQLLNIKLGIWAETNGGIVFGPDLGIQFADMEMRGPDCAWLSSARYQEPADIDDDGWLEVCPEFVAELRSQSDRASRIEAKMEFWMSRGAELGWLLDPRRKLVIIYRAGQEAEVRLRPEWMEGEGPLAGFRMPMSEFWK